MANFPVDPLTYIPRGGVLSDGGGELKKRTVSLSSQHIRRYEDLALVNCEENFTALERHEFLLLIHHYLTQVLRLQVQRYGVYPFAGSSSRAFKGKGIMAKKPSLQQFVNAAMDEKVVVDKLIVEEQNNNGQLVPTHANNTSVEDEVN
ncbi:hypothetical protein GUJ93_ZPchr0002g24075 [Zizania palustris]|uniref:DUF7597 domain-containing protein n=1 Tax=Zizania palustris TaxID=103762 RepID=A0A8J5RZE6_ZIZPA|nr:hypothetical protein GUJ93_ZPchr0002g24075 [Zizania palustris]